MSTNATDNADAVGGAESDGSLDLDSVSYNSMHKPAPTWPAEVNC